MIVPVDSLVDRRLMMAKRMSKALTLPMIGFDLEMGPVTRAVRGVKE